jgi:hypothetical protein
MHEIGAFEAKNRLGALLARYRAFWSRAFSAEIMTISLACLRKAGLPEG